MSFKEVFMFQEVFNYKCSLCGKEYIRKPLICSCKMKMIKIKLLITHNSTTIK